MATIIDLLRHQASCRGDAPAVIADDTAFTWSELDIGARRLSTLLLAKGVARGQHVALLCSNRPAFLVAWFGIANCGATTVSLNTGLIGDGLQYAVRQSGARTLLVEQALWNDKRGDLEPVVDGSTLILFDGDRGLMALLAGLEPAPCLVGRDEEPCTLIYTSGTTGRPKGVINSHRAYMACGRYSTQLMKLDADDRIMIVLPLFHTNPQMYAVMSALTVGCAVVVRPRFSAGGFFDDARRHGCTAFTYVGSVLAMLTSRVTGLVRDHPLRRGMGGGAPSDIWHAVEERFGIVVHELYGMTEIGGWVTGNTEGESRIGSCGKARPDVEVRIFDDRDEPVPPGQAGEIVVRPKEPFIFLSSYYDNPAASWAAARNFWFHTGDAGSMDADDYLYFHGRLSEIIRRGGENIAPSEIETALLAHPAIQEAAVVGVPDPIWGEEIKAVVVPRSSIRAEEVRHFLAGRVAKFMLPRYVQFTADIPKTETQKVRRQALRDLAGEVVDLVEGSGGHR